MPRPTSAPPARGCPLSTTTDNTPAKLDNGKPGDVVFLCVDLDLAEHMRRVRLPAFCYVRDAQRLAKALERRAVVVLYQGSVAATLAHQAADDSLGRYHAKRAGTLDFAEMHFTGKPDEFVKFWNSQLEGDYESALDFIPEAARRTKWKRPLGGDGAVPGNTRQGPGR